jgi:hypothetical protein
MTKVKIFFINGEAREVRMTGVHDLSSIVNYYQKSGFYMEKVDNVYRAFPYHTIIKFEINEESKNNE